MAEQASGPGLSGSAELAEAHGRLLADKSLQFSLMKAPPPRSTPPPDLPRFGAPTDAIGTIASWVFWAGLAVVIGAILFFILREVINTRWKGGRRTGKLSKPEDETWRPTDAQARLLLNAADALAAQGRYAEAAHHLLLHSIQDVEDQSPRSIRPALTSRDIAGLTILSPEARAAFGLIAEVVERSYFGGRPVDAQDYARCRRAYGDFALGSGGL